MTKNVKTIIMKDKKKYEALVEYTSSEENRMIYFKIVNFFEELLEES